MLTTSSLFEQTVDQLLCVGAQIGYGAYSKAYERLDRGTVYLIGCTADDYLKKEIYEYFGLLEDVKYFGPMQVLEVKRLQEVKKHPYVGYLELLEDRYYNNYYMVFMDVATDPMLPEYLQLWGQWMIESLLHMSVSCTDDDKPSNWLYDPDSKRYYPVDAVIANYRQSMSLDYEE